MEAASFQRIFYTKNSGVARTK